MLNTEVTPPPPKKKSENSRQLATPKCSSKGIKIQKNLWLKVWSGIT